MKWVLPQDMPTCSPEEAHGLAAQPLHPTRDLVQPAIHGRPDVGERRPGRVSHPVKAATAAPSSNSSSSCCSLFCCHRCLCCCPLLGVGCIGPPAQVSALWRCIRQRIRHHIRQDIPAIHSAAHKNCQKMRGHLYLFHLQCNESRFPNDLHN
jgi:hypothetical protein